MTISTIKKITLSCEEREILRKAEAIILNLLDALGDDYYDDLSSGLYEVYSQESWEIELELEKK